MKATINRIEFLKALKIARQQTCKPTTGLNTDCVLLEAQDTGILRMVGTTTAQSVVVKIPAAVEVGGRASVKIKRLVKIINALSGEELTISGTEKNGKFVVTDQKATCTLRAVQVDDTYAVSVQDRSCETPAPHLLELASRVLFAASEDDYLPTLQCVNFNGSIATTNGFQIAMVPGEIVGIQGLIPAKTLRDARRIFHQEDIFTWQEKDRIAFSNGAATLESYMGDGEFPNYHAIFPKSHKLTAEFLTAELLEALAPILTVVAHRRPVHMEFQDTGTVQLTGGDEEYEESVCTELQALVTRLDDDFSFPFTVAINPNMLRDQIAQAGESVMLLFNAKNTPISVWPTDPENLWRGVIMPMHVG